MSRIRINCLVQKLLKELDKDNIVMSEQFECQLNKLITSIGDSTPDITESDESETKENAIYVRNELLKAQQIKCTCSGFVIQYQGCCCERAQKIAIAKKKRDNFFAGL